MPRTILVFGEKEFKIVIPDGASLTFGPFAPPNAKEKYTDERKLTGTLRVYQGKASAENVIAVFSPVRGFRDLSLEYEEKIAVEEGATIWKSDQHGYSRESKVSSQNKWVSDPDLLEEGKDNPREGKELLDL